LRNTTVIFLTGAATLALEVLASRILTPYFGISLYIWAGILSVTLIALAIGYRIGGVWARKLKGDDASIEALFAALPAYASLLITLSCLIYPFIFVPLGLWSLIGGAFLANLILLGGPLVLLSAMNCLLIALQKTSRSRSDNDGDGGAGRIFYISTMGSVVGVLVSAFVLVPQLSNFRSTLLISFFLGCLSLYATKSPTIPLTKRYAAKWAILSMLLSGILFAMADWYLGRESQYRVNNSTIEVVHEQPSFYGNVQIVEHRTLDRANPATTEDSDKFRRAFVVDGVVQGQMSFPEKVCDVNYIFALTLLGRNAQPTPNRLLVLGMAAGLLPMLYAGECEIDVVDINPHTLDLATEFFEFDPEIANFIVQDARTYVRYTPEKYDMVVIDLFQSGATPEYLVTSEFFHDIAARLTPDGIVLFNIIAAAKDEPRSAYMALLRTIDSVFPEWKIYHRQQQMEFRNMFVVAAATALPRLDLKDEDFSKIPEKFHASLKTTLAQEVDIHSERLAQAPVLTDAHNLFPHLSAQDDVNRKREVALEKYPPIFLAQ